MDVNQNGRGQYALIGTLLALIVSSATAVPPEVAGLRFQSEGTLTWNAVPARRFLALVKNGAAADCVEDGKEPLRNPDAVVSTTSRELTGVYLHTGEFFLSAVDLQPYSKPKRDREPQWPYSAGASNPESFTM